MISVGSVTGKVDNASRDIIMLNLNVERYELKYFINHMENHALVNRLKHALKSDPHSVPHRGYSIRSVYFDSYDDECLHEKLAGTQFRRKYRLRSYNTEDETVKFEIKNKANNQIFKETASIGRESAHEIILGNYEEMLKYNNPILNKIYIAFKTKMFKPKVMVEYERDAFIFHHFNVRITIDNNLRANTSCFDLFSRNFHALPVVLEGKDILEIKYNTVLPDFIRNVIQLDSLERSAISKYALSRRFLKTSYWEDI